MIASIVFLSFSRSLSLQTDQVVSRDSCLLLRYRLQGLPDPLGDGINRMRLAFAQHYSIGRRLGAVTEPLRGREIPKDSFSRGSKSKAFQRPRKSSKSRKSDWSPIPARVVLLFVDNDVQTAIPASGYDQPRRSHHGHQTTHIPRKQQRGSCKYNRDTNYATLKSPHRFLIWIIWLRAESGHFYPM